MRLDGKSIQAAIMQLVDDYKFDPYQVLEIVKSGIKSGFKKDFPQYKKSEIMVSDDAESTVKFGEGKDRIRKRSDKDCYAGKPQYCISTRQ